ncbi:MAG TPA: hypothetical protein VFA46_09855 [Actinomycetes bacterium]|jgi:hypothetical protein|nr:hypothetical protein [Actinomycetes bacterium]
MPAPGRADTRVAVAVATVAVAVALALAPLASTRVPAAPLAWLGAFGVLLAAGAAWRWAALVPSAVGVLAAEYMLSLYHRGGPVDARAPLFAAGYLLLAELAHWSGEAHRLVRDERAVVAHRLAVLVVLALGSVALGALILFAAGLPLAGPITRLALGVTAATITLALIASLTRHGARRH